MRFLLRTPHAHFVLALVCVWILALPSSWVVAQPSAPAAYDPFQVNLPRPKVTVDLRRYKGWQTSLRPLQDALVALTYAYGKAYAAEFCPQVGRPPSCTDFEVVDKAIVRGLMSVGDRQRWSYMGVDFFDSSKVPPAGRFLYDLRAGEILQTDWMSRKQRIKDELRVLRSRLIELEASATTYQRQRRESDEGQRSTRRQQLTVDVESLYASLRPQWYWLIGSAILSVVGLFRWGNKYGKRPQ